MSPPLRPGPFVCSASRLLPGRPRLAGRLCPQPTVTTATGEEVLLDDVLGDGFAVLARGVDWIATLDEDARAFFTRLNTRYIGVISSGSLPPLGTSDDVEVICDTHRALDRWLTRGRAAAVLLRPDRTVLIAGGQVDLTEWHRELASRGVQVAMDATDLSKV